MSPEKALRAGEMSASDYPARRADAAGLSKLHNRTVDEPTLPNTPSLTWYPGASLVDINVPRQHPTERDRKPKQRGKIKEWSSASRAGLKRVMSMMKREALGQALVITLTYPAEFPAPEDHEVYKRHLHTFVAALRRKWAACSGVWKLEFQSRGAAHYHLMLFGLAVELLENVRSWMRESWYRIAHNGDKHLGSAAIQVDPIRSVGGAVCYMVKYLSKGDQTMPGNFSGRYWGRINEKCLPVVEAKTVEMAESVAVKVRRIARKKMEKDMNDSLWKRFFKNNPNAWQFGSRVFWEALKSARHGGARVVSWMVKDGGEWEGPDGEMVYLPWEWRESRNSVGLIDKDVCRLPARWKARNNDRVRLFCDASTFIGQISRLSGKAASSFLAFSQGMPLLSQEGV